MANNQLGTIIQQGSVMRINNAFVEDVSCFNNSNGNILISYSVRERNNINTIQTIQLNLNRGTTVLNSFGQRMCICCIEPGMWVNVVFSARMTRSIPPQANAFLVAVQRNPVQPPRPVPPVRPVPPLPPIPPVRPIPPFRPVPPVPPVRPVPPLPPVRPVPPLPPVQPGPPVRPVPSVTTGRITLIDFDNNFFYTEDPNNRNNQTKFIVTNTTTFTNRFGAPISFNSLWPGQMVRVTHANFMTASIPPQTTAFNVQVI